MDAVIRILLRLLLVPLGALVAVTVAALIAVVGEWHEFMAQIAANATMGDEDFMTLVMFGPFVVVGVAAMAVVMLTPGAIGIAIAEAFAIRSWLFHLANGVLSAWVGWSLLVRAPDDRFLGDPKQILTAGLGAGLAYWLIAGWNAGLVAPRRPAPPPAASAPTTPVPPS